jgi:signal transduction histidine kinase
VSRSWPRRLATGLLIATIAALAAGASLGVAGGAPGLGLEFVPVLLAFAAVGWLIAGHRARNPIGWLFLTQGLAFAIAVATAEYAKFAAAAGLQLPVVPWVAWAGAIAGELFFVFPLALLLFPDGKLLSAPWRVVAAAFVAAEVLMLLMAALSGAALRAQGSAIPSPVQVIPLRTAESVIQFIQTALLPATLMAAAGCVIRYRRSSADVRHQIKWFAYAGLLTAAGLLVFGLALNNPLIAFSALGPLIPVATGVAIMKFRLYDIDVIIRRTIVYGAMGVFITAVYVAVVVGLGSLGPGRLGGSSSRPSLALSILATVVIAVAFQPVRERVQRLASHLVYGRRATPYQALSEFAGRLGGGYANEDVLPRMARILAEGTGAQRAIVWLAAQGALHSAGCWPADASVPDSIALPVNGDVPEVAGACRVLLVHHDGNVLGALSVSKRASDVLTPVEDKLLTDLSAQAGLILRNVGLNEQLIARLDELQASRLRIVQAQDNERRRIERDLHDGAQQQLLRIASKLKLARSIAGQDEEQELAVLGELREETRQALATLRELAHGINPPVLTSSGLAAAVGSLASKSVPPAALMASGLGRYPEQVETAVYFCCAEALQNAAKHAPGAMVTLRITESSGCLSFSAADDGPGFDPAAVRFGTGLQNMTDRLSVVGGQLEVTALPGAGTTVTGHVTLATSAAAGLSTEPRPAPVPIAEPA